MNPAEEYVDTVFVFKVQVYKEWDEIAGEPSQMLSSSQQLGLGPLRPPPVFILQDGQATTQEYARTVITMNTTVEVFESDGGTTRFEANVASALGVDPGDVQVMSVRSGSVIVDYNVYVPRGGSLEDLLAR